MADDWKPGDLALCVNAGPCALGYVPPELVEGKTYRVYGIGTDEQGDLGLFLDEVESECYAGGYLAWRFRKIHPHAPDAEDAETLRLLNGTPAPKVPA